ncbi:methyltransferase domain-containing protein [Candidatus Riflebacteria bacterium]
MISNKHKQVIRIIHQTLKGTDIVWAITGSLGFALHGMTLSVADIDLQTDKSGAYKIENIFSSFVSRNVKLCETENIKSHFGEIVIEGLKVEIIGAIQKKLEDGKWEEPNDVRKYLEFINFAGIELPVLSLEYEEGAYRKLGRIEKADRIKNWLEEQKGARNNSFKAAGSTFVNDNSDLRTHYKGHDSVYKKHKAGNLRGWDADDGGYEEFQSRIEKVLNGRVAPQKGRLLELGCGAGNMSVWFAQKGYDVFGIDIAPAAIAWARERAKSGNIPINFFEGDVVSLKKFPQGNFDFVFDGHCLHCIIGQDRQQLLKNVLRILKPGGYFLVDTMCAPVDTKKIQDYDLKSRCTITRGIVSRYFGEPENMIAEIKAAGFKIIRDTIEPGDANGMLVVEAVKPGWS